MKNLTANKEELHSKQILLTFLKNKKDTILPIVIVFCLPVLLYLQTLSFGFIDFDDHEIISKNINFLSDFRNAPQAFLTDAFIGKINHFYRPLQTLSYMADIQLSGGNNIWMYHLTNILLLGLIACLLFLLFRKFLIPFKLALLSTLIYCAHPLFISSTAWIPARGDLLLSFFSLLSFLFFIEHLQKKKVIYLFLHWLTFTIALFCKETAAFLPFLFVIYYFTYSFEKRFEKKYLLNIVLYTISGIFWFWLRSIATGNLSNQNDVGLIILVSNLRIIPESLARFFLPFDSALISSFSLFYTLTGLGIIILIIVIFFINKERTKKEKVFCLSWFLFLLLPTMIVKIEFIDYLSHRFFLPLLGILLFVIFSFPKKWLEEKDFKRKIVVNGGYFCIFALLSSLTFIKSRSYSDPITFYNSSISQNPDNVLMYINRGYAKDIRSDFQGAIEDFTKAIELNPNYAVSYNNRGSVYSAKGDLKRAIKDYDKAIELNPNYVDAYNNRGKAYNDTGNYDQAIKDINKAIELNPAFADAYNNRGTVYSAKGNLDNAIKDYDEAIELNPNYAEAYNDLGLAYQAIGYLESAIKDYDKAIELKPSIAEAYYNRGNAYSAKDYLDNAIIDYDKAIELNPNYAEAYNNLGLAYQAKGDLESAIKDYDKAIELKPGIAEAYYNRGNSYLVKGDLESAINYYDKAIKLKPGYAAAYGIRGIAYSKKGDLNTAIKDYKKTIELNPGDANAYGNMGNACKAKGMLKEAEQDFKMYEKLKNK
ncbi:MAG: tetratricopeptide repeat protein [Bacteroidota bacterium]